MHQTFSQYNLVTKLAKKYSHSTYLASPINEPEHQVVLTLFSSSLCHSLHECESLLLKAKRIKQLKHEHLVPILDIGLAEEQVFTARDYLPQGSVRSLMKSLSPQSLKLQDALKLLLQVGEALVYAHDLHIFHGSLKPENILFDANGQVVVTDFNLLSHHDLLIHDYITDEY